MKRNDRTKKTKMLDDAKATYAMRLQLGDEAFRIAINQQFFGQ